jgi:hypothetical protein
MSASGMNGHWKSNVNVSLVRTVFTVFDYKITIMR